MQPVYRKKAPSDRRTWIDWFVALEPKGGFRDTVGDARQVAERVDVNPISLPPARKRERAAA